MHKAQQDVAEFHSKVLKREDPTTPAIRRPELRAELILEEACETVEKLTGRKIYWDWGPVIDDPDLIGAIDGLIDLLYVTYGTGGEMGIDLEPFWDEVHAANMRKANGPVREDGKQLKPEGWEPPDLYKVFTEQLNKKLEADRRLTQGLPL